MALVSKLVYETEFFSTDTILVQHGANSQYIGCKVIIAGEYATDKLFSIYPTAVDPQNEAIVKLKSPSSGIVQIFLLDVVTLSLPASQIGDIVTGGSGSGGVSIPPVTVPANDSVVVDGVSIFEKKSVKWFVRIQNMADERIKSFEINAQFSLVRGLSHVRFGELGEYFDMNISVLEQAGNMNLIVYNNESYEFIVSVQRFNTP